MVVGEFGHHAATRCALDEAFHDEEWLVDILYRPRVFADGCGYGAQANGAAAKLVDNRQEDLIVDFIETIFVDVEGLQGHFRQGVVDASIAFHLGKVAHTAQESVGNTGRATAAASSLMGTFSSLAERRMIFCRVSGA